MEYTKMCPVEVPTIGIFFYKYLRNFIAQLCQQTRLVLKKTSAAGRNTLAAPPPLNLKKICNARFCCPANALQEYL